LLSLCSLFSLSPLTLSFRSRVSPLFPHFFTHLSLSFHSAFTTLFTLLSLFFHSSFTLLSLSFPSPFTLFSLSFPSPFALLSLSSPSPFALLLLSFPLSPPTVLYIPIDACGDYFSTSWMYSASCTSGMYLRIWGWAGRYAGGGLVRVVRPFFRQVVRTPVKAKIKLQQNCLARINQVNGAASRVSLLSAIGF
jgi:hypothetical protein